MPLSFLGFLIEPFFSTSLFLLVLSKLIVLLFIVGISPGAIERTLLSVMADLSTFMSSHVDIPCIRGLIPLILKDKRLFLHTMHFLETKCT